MLNQHNAYIFSELILTISLLKLNWSLGHGALWEVNLDVICI